ncbi:MAG TPA: hypothetical protein VKP67_28005 [Xanthobacteraceae bacterium]|nr:hypothetical protein [Xanthobacteraceae bacterium]
MQEPAATYRRFADECRLMAKMMPEEQRPILLEHAAAWTKLAEEAERKAPTKKTL